MFFSALYLGWAFLGHTLTGWFPFFFLSTKEVGTSEAVWLYSIGFVLLAPFSE
jgi:hypothetical protein